MWWWLAACDGTDPGARDTRPEPTGTPTLTFPEARRPRNLLFVSMDTTRRDHLDPWSTDGVNRSDFLASLFARGVTLDDHVQCSNWTFASTSCTLRGRLMEETGFYPRLEQDLRAPLPEGQPTLARRLGAHGFHSVLLSSNGWLSPDFGNAQGYTEFRRMHSGDARAILGLGVVALREVVDAGAPWFVHVHLVDPHPPYTLHEGYTEEIDRLPPVPWDLDSSDGHYDTTGEWPDMTDAERQALLAQLEARYTAEIRYLDDQVEWFWETADAEGLLDDTLVVFWNDHGEQMFEHGHQSHAFGLQQEENAGFAVFLAPDLAPARHTGPTHAIDVVPTVLDALGFPAGDDPELPGYVVGTAPAGRPRFAASVARLGPLVSVIAGRHKLIWELDAGRLRFYDRVRDPAELHDRFEPDDPDVERLWAWLRPHGELLAPLAPDHALRYPEHMPR